MKAFYIALAISMASLLFVVLLFVAVLAFSFIRVLYF